METKVNINQLKRQLNIEESYVADDTILQNFINVAEVAIQNYLGVNSLTGYTATSMPVTIEQAVLMLSAHFYLNRSFVAFAQSYEIPYTYKFLLDYYKDWTIQ